MKSILMKILVFTFLASASALKGVPLELNRIELADGKTFEGVRQIRVTPSRISFLHKDGAASVKITDLPEDIRAKLAYDPEAAAKHEAAQRETQAEFEREVERVLAEQAMTGDKNKELTAKAKAQIVNHYYEYQGGGRTVSKSQRVEWAKRYLTEAKIPVSKQDAMIEGWLPEAEKQERERRARLQRVYGTPEQQMRERGRSVPDLPYIPAR